MSIVSFTFASSQGPVAVHPAPLAADQRVTFYVYRSTRSVQAGFAQEPPNRRSSRQMPSRTAKIAHVVLWKAGCRAPSEKVADFSGSMARLIEDLGISPFQ
jgi:hypothetical protein